MIRIELDVMLARRKMTLTELSRRLDIALPTTTRDCIKVSVLEGVMSVLPS